MSVRSVVNNVNHTVNDGISMILNNTRTKFQSIIGTATTSMSNIWSGGFTGMSETGIEELKTQLEQYCDDVQSVISGFDEDGDISIALKGDTYGAAREFISAVKELLQAYVSRLLQECEEATEAYNSFKSASQSIAQDVSSDAQDIRATANEIRLD